MFPIMSEIARTTTTTTRTVCGLLLILSLIKLAPLDFCLDKINCLKSEIVGTHLALHSFSFPNTHTQNAETRTIN